MVWAGTDLPLVGRQVELERIVRALKETEPAAFVLAGAAGVGKTRLAAEASAAASELGFATAAVRASASPAAIPFGPFAPLFPVGDLPTGDVLALLRHAAAAIVERAGPDRRLLLVVDDAHLLDDGSAALVAQLVQTGSCSLLATVRTPSPVPDPITASWKDGLADRVDLDPLGEAEVGMLMEGMLGGPVTGGTVRRFWEASRGNALYLRELLFGASGSRALGEQGGMWSLNRSLTPPERLVELVAPRIGGLAPDPLFVVELLAVGEPLGLAFLEQRVSAEAVEECERLGLVQIAEDGRRADVRLGHPLFGEAVRRVLPRSRLRHHSAALADAVRDTGARRREDLLRLGRWRLDSGGRGDPELLESAARRAGEMFDLELAARLAHAALDSGGGVRVGIVLGEAKFRSGSHEEALEVLAGLVPLCSSDDELARVTNARAHVLSNLMGDDATAAAIVEEALARITDEGARLRLIARLATIQVIGDDPQVALATAGPVLASSDEGVVSLGAFVASMALAQLGRGPEAVAMSERGLEAHHKGGRGRAATARIAEMDALPVRHSTIWEFDVVWRGRAWGLVASGEPSKAVRLLMEAADEAAALHFPVAEARLCHDVARISDPAPVVPRLAELADRVDGELVKAMAAHASAWARHSAPRSKRPLITSTPSAAPCFRPRPTAAPRPYGKRRVLPAGRRLRSDDPPRFSPRVAIFVPRL